MHKKIRTALVSVYHKEGLEQIVPLLNKLNIKVFASGGTYDFLQGQTDQLESVESLTGYPSILDGRVKTLHPAVFSGILARQDQESHRKQLENHDLPFFDLVVVDLYPFEETLASGASVEQVIEKIDVGGIALIRAAAKNFNDVVIIPSRKLYPELELILKNQEGGSPLNQRRELAAQAFAISSQYDRAISAWLAPADQPSTSPENGMKRHSLRYGENPHQSGAFLGNLEEVIRQIHGKELSYNNLLDVDAALSYLGEFDESCIAIIKHNNSCGLAADEQLPLAWKKALAGDPLSAFGGVIACNREIDADVASKMNEIFFEVLLAPDFEAEALEILCSKKNRILLKYNRSNPPAKLIRSALNGLLEQSPDLRSETAGDLRRVSEREADEGQLNDLLFALRIVKHTRSNAIVLVKNRQLIGLGAGQTSRIDALKHAIVKAGEFGFDLSGAVTASDAFFPFADCVEIAYAAGITAIVQPGGSIRDQESIDASDRLGMSMYFTGIRHFKH